MQMRYLKTAVVAALVLFTAGSANARLAEVTVIDRLTGETLPVHWHRGECWIAGAPGHRYAISVHNRTTSRLLAVLSVDGVNAITGQTAAWNQSGYVLDAGQRAEVRGWRKSQERVAAFEFATLAESYAARTGRPQHVGVIGVALFREAPPAATLFAPQPEGVAQRSEAESPSAKARDQSEPTERAASRLGTGHGRSEASRVELTRFERARPQPDQVITIRYDSRANLIAMGILAAPPPRHPDPFPGAVGFVPDPPRR